MEPTNTPLVPISADIPMNIDEEPKKTSVITKNRVVKMKLPSRQPLRSKKAVEFLLAGSLRSKVCRYCLFVDYTLHGMDEVMNIAGQHAIYKVKIRDLVASFYPSKISQDPDLPNRICSKCLNTALKSYLFVQQCEQSERALRNFIDDFSCKVDKLDPLERTNKRGRHKLKPNHNVITTEHVKVIDYAEPLHHLINSESFAHVKEPIMTELECKKCWQVLPSLPSLINHEKSHPKTMWYNCRMCGKSYTKIHHFRKHIKQIHSKPCKPILKNEDYRCNKCTFTATDLNVYLQHIEKHKFKVVLEHLVHKDMDQLCSICFDKGKKMIDMKTNIVLFGGYPELRGYRTLYNIVGSTVPEMSMFKNYIGRKMCENCLDKAMIAYIFINKTHYIINRLNNCVNGMIDKLKDYEGSERNLFIEIADNAIMPLDINDVEFDDILSENEDETKVNVDVLEDEYRLKSDDESDEQNDQNSKSNGVDSHINNKVIKTVNEKTETTQDLKKVYNSKINYKTLKSNKNKRKTNIVNGYKSKSNVDLQKMNEFLTFKNIHKKKVARINNCPLCDKNFISKHFLKQHLKKHINRKVNCKICSIHFKSEFILQEHVKYTHVLNNKHNFTCSICYRIFKSENKFINHKVKHKNIECLVCNKVLKDEKYYFNHIQKHVPKNINSKPLRCDFCGKLYADDNKLISHINKAHYGVTPYNCDMCNKAFYTEDNLKYHKKVHDIIKKETCEFCNKILKCRRSLVVHIRKHLNIKPNKCAWCNKDFYSERHLNYHQTKMHQDQLSKNRLLNLLNA